MNDMMTVARELTQCIALMVIAWDLMKLRRRMEK